MTRGSGAQVKTAAGGRGFFPPPLALANGTVEAIKWIALLLMVVDHVNKYVFHEASATAFFAGRLVMPLFAFVLAFNLARPGSIERGGGKRTLARLLLIGAASTVPYIALGDVLFGWWPLNIMATLAVAVAMIELLSRGTTLSAVGAGAVFLVGGALVEFWWPGVIACVAAWFYCRRPSWMALAVWVGALSALYVINRNLGALLALPVIFGASQIRLRLPRVKWFFYLFYPAHLAALWMIR
ncbi:MAG: conjugal transfer protein TraX [Burkholderiales bacterium PBB6]|jgi:hypothetical protein|uniref:TraX protein n=2 Tax=Bacteria TaxID=2 RepID=R0CD60_RALPI|nr:TraX family protein [Ralstonia sp. 11b]ENZ74886.1 hypothetical protein OR214_05158 [Ralstonia pickettii OR214]OYT84259.1 MAG: conjugal transfer protein TraX [Burkholderiales bacterium PBB6]